MSNFISIYTISIKKNYHLRMTFIIRSIHKLHYYYYYYCSLFFCFVFRVFSAVSLLQCMMC